MPISTVIQRNNSLILYDERGRQKAIIPLASGGAALQGYTAATVSVRSGNTVLLYDERGRQVGIVPVSIR